MTSQSQTIRPGPRRLALAGVLALSAVLNTHRLAQNGYANIFYSAGVKSMLRSLHNFVFASFDPGGLVTVDKPPLALWVQVTSAKLFGFSPLSLLLPEAIAGVLAVALLHLILARRLGALAAFAGALALAVFPSFVAVSRDNGGDPLLVLLMVLACGAGLRATETGRWRTLLWCGVLVGLAFNTKTLAAYLVVPGIALAYVVGAPGSIARRVGQLAVAGLVMLAVSFAWIALVELTPASKRPFVGSSTNNSELGLTFAYNGVGRVEGQEGGPGHVPVRPGAFVPAARQLQIAAAASTTGARGSSAPRAAGSVHAAHPAHAPAAPAPAAPAHSAPAPRGAPAPAPRSAPAPRAAPPRASSAREKNPIPFGGPPSPLRLFGVGLGDQGAWMLPFALFGLVGLALLALLDHGPAERPEQPSPQARGRRDPRLATALVFGGWFLVEAAVLSLSTGIVHPYYVSALGPGTGAMVGAGAVAMFRLARRERLFQLLPALALLLTLIVTIVLLRREYNYLHWLWPILVGVIGAAIVMMIWEPHVTRVAIVAGLAVLLVAPALYSASTWEVPVNGTFPAAGPYIEDDVESLGIPLDQVPIYGQLLRFLHTHGPPRRWDLFTQGATTAAPLTLLGGRVAALGGYGTIDPVLEPAALAALVARGEVRYIALGGGYATRGGNAASTAVAAACLPVPPALWRSPQNIGTPAHPLYVYPHGGWNLQLYDCAGRSAQLAASQ